MKMRSQDIVGAKLKANSHRKRRCSTLLCGIILLCEVGVMASQAPYSQPLTTMAGQPRNDDTFRPILPIDISPEFISRNVFTKSGQYRVFQPAESESDLRLTVAMRRRNFKHPSDAPRKEQPKSTTTESLNTTASIEAELKGLEDLLVDYVEQFFSQGKFEPTPGLVLALQQNHSHPQTEQGKRTARSILEDTNVELNVPRAFESARLLFFSGLKKVMWPIYMGLQVLKSVLFAMFLPTIISSVSRLIGKGITSGSAGSVPLFIRPMEPPQELDFRDNSVNFDDDSKFSLADEGKTPAGYEYNAEASQQQAQYAQVNGNALSQATLSRYGGQQMMQDTYLSALQSIGAASFKNSQSMSGSLSAGGGVGAPGMTKKPTPAVMNTFQSFQKVPSSSLLLSNYDPFYSPLLSRLDSVFAQLKLDPENEACREKLICLMYANPAKYAPYSNLVSAQLSRELNELRKPTSDNPDILRFFKYMRAAKDGQDGVDCDQSFAKCKELKDFENPAMLSTYNDINKLVQARKLA
ncbi:uncharacterized protein Osi24 [Drosophila kikkawai]|uniref:Uncharacterized protein Osi24 n=1 Tax=Drosophila kikkawai TaxID=30033 RepID=A0ABM3C643_DROKI|nr:uncharacterized protein LOC108085596 [Drosophila kikkawai]XP_041631656.1 uncharacterized protein LOC108085596 [Drosophila kikkawai]XP_041631657.1 uncharacterized protein LOC108085596 [Drosophila kikkawai]